jgi:hypothetical protein
VHQRPHRGPARRRCRHRGPPRRRGRTHAGRPRVRAGAAPGRAGGPRQGVHRRRGRVASRRVLDVPGDEPGPARAGGAQRLDVQPQLRGAPGQGWADPPRQPARRGRDRPARHAPSPADLVDVTAQGGN